MTVTASAAAGFEIGRVISRTFGVLGRNFVTFLLLAMLLVGLPTGAATFLQLVRTLPLMAGAVGSDTQTFAPASIALTIGAGLVGAMANAVLQGAIIHGAVGDLTGKRASFGECLGTGLRFLLPLIAIGLISAVCLFVGFLLLIVPGVLLALAWSVTAPVRVVERTTVFGAFGRSLELTRNCRASIFALAIIVGVASLIINIAVGAIGLAPLMAMANRPSGGAFAGVLFAQAVVSLISQTLSALVGATGIASVYYELRQVKEGIGAEQLAAVFD
jgi:hypothetical protein